MNSGSPPARTWPAWGALAAALVALAYTIRPTRFHGPWVVALPFLIGVCVVIVRELWQRPPAVAMCGAIALSIFSGSWSEMGLGRLPLDRLLLALVVLQLLVRAPGAAHTPRLQLRPVHLALLATALYALGSALAAGTLGEEAGVLSLVDQLGIMPYLMFLLAPAVFACERDRRMLIATLVGVGAYLGVTAVFESLGPQALVLPHYIARVDAILPEARAGGPFQSSVSEGFATFACAVAAVIAFVHWRGRSRYAAGFVCVVCAFACFLTLERGVWIAAAAATFTAALVTRAGRQWLIPGILASVLLIGVVLAVSPSLTERVDTRVSHQASVWDRQDQTSAALRMIAARPLFGFGWATYTTASIDYFRQSSSHPLVGYSTPEARDPLHDSYLSYAVELGLVGALMWLTCLVWGVGDSIFTPGDDRTHPWKVGLLSIGVFFLVVSLFNPYLQTFPVLLLWVWAGVATPTAELPQTVDVTSVATAATAPIAVQPA